jgi:hypothetical protein
MSRDRVIAVDSPHNLRLFLVHEVGMVENRPAQTLGEPLYLRVRDPVFSVLVTGGTQDVLASVAALRDVAQRTCKFQPQWPRP